jgi:hypothetical protein
MSRTPGPRLRHGVGAVKVGVTAVVAVLAVGPGLTGTPASGPTIDGTPRTTTTPATTPATGDRQQDRLAALMTEHDCSPTGFGAGVVPGSALVERHHRVRHVSFDDGWAAFTGAAPGRLLAVCRAAP